MCPEPGAIRPSISALRSAFSGWSDASSRCMYVMIGCRILRIVLQHPFEHCKRVLATGVRKEDSGLHVLGIILDKFLQ